MFRQIIRPETKEDLIIRLPEKYIGKEVEVEATELKSSDKKRNIKKSKKRELSLKDMFKYFDKHLVSTKDFKFNREEANER